MATSPVRVPLWLPILLLSLGTSPATGQVDSAVVIRVPEGFENISSAPGAPAAVSYENRRWRHSAEALGRLRRAVPTGDSTGTPFVAFERRLGLVAAAIRPIESGGRTRFEVHYPSDPSFPQPPPGPLARRTFWRPDVEVQPLVSYALGRIFDPVLLRLAVSPQVRLSPWPGALATAAVEIPIRNDFSFDRTHSDIDRVRPGQGTLDQFAWLPRVALASASAGFFGDNRWGLSLGAARPLAQGALLLDAQADVTGFLSFDDAGVEYSSPDRWTGFGGLVWRPPFLDVAVRAHAARYLGLDRGVELEVRRTMGDLDLGIVGIRSGDVNQLGVRVLLPLPPPVRAAGAPVRFQLADRWPFEHRSSSIGFGTPLRGVASREDFLRQLAGPTLELNQERYRIARGPTLDPFAHDSLDWLSWSGMTGFVNTPWAGVEGDRQFEAGYAQVPARWAYDQRRLHDNQIYSVTIGFLPHVEGSLRATAFPGLRTFEDVVPGSRLTDTDEMVSGRIELLPARDRRPGLAIGVEDLEGTRRFHSTYAVAGLPWRWWGARGRISAGAAPRLFTATRNTLAGGFGAFEVSPIRAAAAQIEYDTEKWSAALAARLPWGLRVRAALLGLTHASFGGSFHFAI